VAAAAGDYEPGMKWLRFGTDLRAFVHGYRRHGVSVPSWLWSYRGRKVHEVFAWDDPVPWVVETCSWIAGIAGRARRLVERRVM